MLHRAAAVPGTYPPLAVVFGDAPNSVLSGVTSMLLVCLVVCDYNNGRFIFMNMAYHGDSSSTAPYLPCVFCFSRSAGRDEVE